MATYLDAILEAHRARVHADHRSPDELEEMVADLGEPRPFASALRGQKEGLAVIAEVKRRSPVMGDLAPDLDPAVLASSYERGGASCLSVLTDEQFFGGGAADLATARVATGLPTLRKDFTVAEADLYDARAMGADAVLLIVAALDEDELTSFVTRARALSLAAVVEVHDEIEVDRAISAGVSIIGVNQRDLHSFEVDTKRALYLRTFIPANVIAVAESGIKTTEDASVLYDAGFDAILVGSSLVESSDSERAVHALVNVGSASKRRL